MNLRQACLEMGYRLVFNLRYLYIWPCVSFIERHPATVTGMERFALRHCVVMAGSMISLSNKRKNNK